MTNSIGMPIEIFNVVIEVQHYGLIITPCSSESRAEMIVDQAYRKYANVLSVVIQQSWLDEVTDDLEWLH